MSNVELQPVFDSMDKNVLKIRSYMEEEYRSVGRISLIKTIAAFDFQEHALPTAQQITSALDGFPLSLVRHRDDIYCEPAEIHSADATGIHLSAHDIESLYRSYLRTFRSRKKDRKSVSRRTLRQGI